MKQKIITLALTTSILSACGGGGGGGGGSSAAVITPAPTSTSSGDIANALSAQGFWNDDTSYNLVTSSGEFWGISTTEEQNSGVTQTVWALDRGSIAMSGSTASGSVVESIPGGSSTQGHISGTLVERSTWSGSVTSGAGSEPFLLSYDSRYDSAANLSQIAGKWTAKAATGSSSASDSVTITNTGAYTERLSSDSGATCIITGTAAPDTSGKNFFRLQAKFGYGACTLPSESMSGVAFLTRSGALVVGLEFAHGVLAGGFVKS